MNGSVLRVVGRAVLRDAVVEQPPARAQPARQEPEVRRQRGPAEVLGEPDRADGVELRDGRVAVVEVAHLGEVAQPASFDLPLRPFRLVARERHAERAHPVLGRGVHDHRAPAAAHVEQPHARPSARASAPRARTSPSAPAPASRRRSGRPRRCRPSTARAPTRRRCSRRRSGARSPCCRAAWSAAGPAAGTRGPAVGRGAAARWAAACGPAAAARRAAGSTA